MTLYSRKRGLVSSFGSVNRVYWVICINVGEPRQCYKKKSDFVQKAGHFHDLAGRGTSGKKAGLFGGTVGRSACVSQITPSRYGSSSRVIFIHKKSDTNEPGIFRTIALTPCV